MEYLGSNQPFNTFFSIFLQIRLLFLLPSFVDAKNNLHSAAGSGHYQRVPFISRFCGGTRRCAA